EPRGEHAARAAGADDDVVIHDEPPEHPQFGPSDLFPDTILRPDRPGANYPARRGAKAEQKRNKSGTNKRAPGPIRPGARSPHSCGRLGAGGPPRSAGHSLRASLRSLRLAP